MLFRTGDRWVMRTESDLDGSYFGGHLGAFPDGGEYPLSWPDPLEEAGDWHTNSGR